MKTISIINLKGGVAKTLTADSMAHVLATFHNKRVLLVDNDKQGNTSKAFGVHSYDDKSISDVLTARRLDPREVIKKTRFENIDVMPANMTLIRANMEVLMDSTRPQQTRLRSALNAIAEENFYDFCIIDNAPDINISTINALVASDDVIIPIKIDKYAFDGLEELKEQIEDTRDDLNPRLRLAARNTPSLTPAFDIRIKSPKAPFRKSLSWSTAAGAEPRWTISHSFRNTCGGVNNDGENGGPGILPGRKENPRVSMRDL